jgi:hypothetical protein
MKEPCKHVNTNNFISYVVKMFQCNSHFSNGVSHNKNLGLEGSRREQQGNNNVVTELVDEQHSDHAESYSLFQPSKKSKHMQVVKQIKT